MIGYEIQGKSPAAAFMEWAEGYYGKYPEGQREDVLEYLLTWNDVYLEALKDCAKKAYSGQYGKPPDIAMLNKLYPEASVEQAARERALRQAALPPPEGTKETDEQKSARLYADMKACGMTMDFKDWFMRVLKYRQSRGDYRKGGHSSRPGGIIRTTKDISEPRPAITWEDLGGMAKKTS